MNLIAVGVNHRTAPIDVRERLFFSDDEIRQSLAELLDSTFKEVVLLSTCNRTELFGVTKDDRLHGEELKQYLIRKKDASAIAFPRHFYSFFDCGTANHLFKIASGIDSMVIGDIQILGQVKDAFTLAVEAKTTGLVTHRLFETALRVGKRVRTDTELCEGAVSISYAAVELASKIFEDLTRKRALLVGAGETGELTAKHLVGRQIGELVVANRTRSKADEVVRSLGGRTIDYGSFMNELLTTDIVITSIASPEFIATEDDLRRIMRQRSNNPLFIIDIGLPRNIDPASRKIDNVFLYDIDALNQMIDRNLEKRKAQVPKVNQIIIEELATFYQWFEALQVNPTIQQLRDMLESIRSEEVGRQINRFAESDRELVQMLTKRIINKILHTPMVNLKNGNGATEEETMTMINTLRHLFGLEHRSNGS